jgi:uncharacterized protein HemY
VAGLIESIRSSSTQYFSEHNAHESLHYIAQVQELGLINDAQRAELESNVHQALLDWRRQPRSGFWNDDGAH